MDAIVWFAMNDNIDLFVDPRSNLMDLLNDICEIFGRTRKEIRKYRRFKELVIIRHLFCYVAYKTGRYTLWEIANKIGVRDHTTVMNGRDSARDHIAAKDVEFLKYWNKYLMQTKLATFGKESLVSWK